MRIRNFRHFLILRLKSSERTALSNSAKLLLKKRRNNVCMGGWYVNVETPFSPEGLSTMLAVHLFVNSLFTFVDGSDMFCHVSLNQSMCKIVSNLINTFLENILLQWGHGMLLTLLCLASPKWTCLICELRFAFVEKIRTHKWHRL